MKIWMKWMALCACLMMLGSCGRREKPDVSDLEDSCVRILGILVRDGDVYPSWGTGFIINKKGDIVTNHHVTSGMSKLFILHRMDGRTRLYSGVLKESSKERDLAVISSSVKGHHLTINTRLPEKGAEVHSIGYPALVDNRNATGPTLQLVGKYSDDPNLGKGGVDITDEIEAKKILSQMVESTFSSGQVTRHSNQPMLIVQDGVIQTKVVRDPQSGKQFEVQIVGDRSVNVVEHNVNIMGGNSGGPLVDNAGYVIGVVGQALNNQSRGESVKYAISGPKELIPFLKDESDIKNLATVDVDASSVGKLSTIQLLLIAICGAALFVALGGGVYFLAKRPAAGPSMTVIHREIKKAMGVDGTTQPLNHAQPPPISPAPQAEVAWEVDVTGPNGLRITPRLTSMDFARAGGKIVFGRNSDFSWIPVRHDSISRQHLHFVIRNGSLAVADRNSSNGTRVNGSPLSVPFREQSLREGDRIEFGELVATVRRSF